MGIKDITPRTWLLILVFAFLLGGASSIAVYDGLVVKPEPLEPQCIEGFFSTLDGDDLLMIADIRLCSQGEWNAVIDAIDGKPVSPQHSPPSRPPFFAPGTTYLQRDSS